VEVRDAGEEPEKGLCYMLMEYMPGGSLKDMIDREGALPIERAISYVSQIAYALALAHRNGVIHRDIKPDNILFTEDGVPKLSDLGIAKFISDTQTSTLTMQGHILGTPAYMAPEQMMDSHHIDARADIYSLGVVLYEMLTGRKPNAGSTLMGLLTKAIKGEPLPDVRKMRPEVSTSVAYVLSLMCAPKPEDRPTSTSVVADLLSRANVDGLILPDAGAQTPPPEKQEESKPSIFSRLFGSKK
jgi:serine/threonine protein kinase